MYSYINRYSNRTLFMNVNVWWVIPSLIVGAVCILRLIENRFIGAIMFSIYVYMSLFFVHCNFYK